MIQARAYLPFSPRPRLSASEAMASMVGWKYACSSADRASKASFSHAE